MCCVIWILYLCFTKREGEKEKEQKKNEEKKKEQKENKEEIDMSWVELKMVNENWFRANCGSSYYES